MKAIPVFSKTVLFLNIFLCVNSFFHCMRNAQFVAPDDSVICYSYRKFLQRVLEVAHCQNIGKLLKDIQNTGDCFTTDNFKH